MDPLVHLPVRLWRTHERHSHACLPARSYARCPSTTTVGPDEVEAVMSADLTLTILISINTKPEVTT